MITLDEANRRPEDLRKAYLSAWGEIDAEFRAGKRPVKYLLDVLAVDPDVMAQKKIIVPDDPDDPGVGGMIDYTPAVLLTAHHYHPDDEIRLERYDSDQGDEYRVWYMKTLRANGDPNKPETLRHVPPDFILFSAVKLNI
jgi:hypothetical protein